jgi:two-component system sensor histidine kinase VicK
MSSKQEILKGDAVLLELAFSNLIGNSIKYTNPGGVVEIVVEDGKSEKEIEVEVCDNGIGIPEKDREKIFREFFRASNVKHKSYEGTGLGLSVVKQIIEQHGGKISFQSPSRLADENGAGTCFRVTLLKI